MDGIWLGLYRFSAFLIAYIAFIIFAYKVDPRFSLKYKKFPSFSYLLFLSLLETTIMLLLLVIFNLFVDQDLIFAFSIDRLFFTWYDIALGLIIGVAIFPLLAIIGVFLSVVRQKFFPEYKSKREEEVRKLIFGSLPKSKGKAYVLLFITSLKAAIFEELIFRGYLLNNLLLLFSPVLAIIVQAILFFMGHLYQGIFNSILPLIFSILLGLIFFLTSSLTIVMLAHFSSDVIGLVMQGLMQGREK